MDRQSRAIHRRIELAADRGALTGGGGSGTAPLLIRWAAIVLHR